MSISQPGDVTIIAPGSVPGDVLPFTRAESVLGSYVTLAAGVSGPPTTANVPASSRRVGMPVFTPADGKTWRLFGGLLDANWIQVAGMSAPAPLNNVFYLDPTYTAPDANGSEFAPSPTVTAILAAMGSIATIYMTPGLAFAGSVTANFGTSKNITFESLGGQSSLPNMTWRGGVGSELHFRNVDAGDILINNTGAGSDSILIEARSSFINSIQHNVIAATRTCDISLFGTHLAPTRLSSSSDTGVAGVVTTNGNIYAERAFFGGNTTCVSAFLNNSYLADATTHTWSENSLLEGGTEFGVGITIHFAASAKTLYMDAETYANYLGSGVTLTGTGASIHVIFSASASQVTNDSTVSGATVKDALNTLKAASGVTTVFGRAGAVVAVVGDYTSTQITNSSSVTSGGATVTSALNSLQSQITASVSGVASVFGRSGTVTAASGDYTSTQITNSSGVTGTTVTAALNTLNSALATAGPITSVFARTGVVVAVAGDYTDAQINNTSTVTGTHVKDALTALNTAIGALVTGVHSVFGRSGTITAASGDYTSTQVTNSSTVTSGGATVTTALNALQSQVSALVLGVSSVFGRTGAVVSASGDYTSTQVTNSSGVTGSTVTAALNTLNASISALVTGVSSVFGRGGAVTATAGDYTSTQVTNSSAVSGSTVTAALNTLNSTVSALVTGVSSVFGRSGAVVAASGDYTTTKITNLSGITGTTNTDALNALLLQYPNGFYGVSGNFTLSRFNIGQLCLVNAANVTMTIVSQASGGYALGSKFSFLLYAAGATLSIVGFGGVTVHGPGPVPIAHLTRFDIELIGADEWTVTYQLIEPTTDNITNTSAVSGSQLTGALNTLNAHSFLGDITIALNQITALASGVPWVFDPNLSLWHTNSLGALFFCSIGQLSANTSIDSLTVWITPPAGHAGVGGLPANMPTLALAYSTPGGTVITVAGTTDSSASVGAYETAHAITLSFSPVFAANHHLYFLLVSEGGAHGLGGTTLNYASCHSPG